MNGFIILCTDESGNELYISNTSPILWTNKREEAKVLSTKRSAIIELEDDFIVLSNTIIYTNLKSIEIVEYRNDHEIGRERYL